MGYGWIDHSIIGCFKPQPLSILKLFECQAIKLMNEIHSPVKIFIQERKG